MKRRNNQDKTDKSFKIQALLNTVDNIFEQINIEQ